MRNIRLFETNRQNHFDNKTPKENLTSSSSASLLTRILSTSVELWRRITILTSFPRTVTNDLAVDSTRHAVVELVVQLGENVF